MSPPESVLMTLIMSLLSHLDPRVAQLATHHRRVPEAPVVVTDGFSVNQHIPLVMKLPPLTSDETLTLR